MLQSERYKGVIKYFTNNKPLSKTELIYDSTYQLLVAVILSAQCTDKRVNKIRSAFFKKFSTVKELANANVNEIFELIKSCSYPNNKAKNLSGMAKTLINVYNGIVPSDVDELQKLPGVGRKTANVIASVIFNKPVMAVDTHVFRVAERIGLTLNASNPLQSEKQLIKHIPKNKIAIAHHWLVLHGKYICKARNPKCTICRITLFCKQYTQKK